jgi:hypothetical protein
MSRPWGQPLTVSVGAKLAAAGVRTLNPRVTGVRLIKAMAENLHRRYTAQDLEIDLSSIVEECTEHDVFGVLFPEVG